MRLPRGIRWEEKRPEQEPKNSSLKKSWGRGGCGQARENEKENEKDWDASDTRQEEGCFCFCGFLYVDHFWSLSWICYNIASVLVLGPQGMWDLRVSQVTLVVKNTSASTGDIRDAASIPGLGRLPGGGNGNPLQYSCLKSLMYRGAWRATVRKVTTIWTWLKWLSTCGILVPQPGIDPIPLALEGETLTTGPPGKSQEEGFE